MLGDLGISHHNTIGIGDAENDLALPKACEIGVAVAASVPSLQEAADIVLDHRAGALLDFLRLEIASGLPGIPPRRFRVEFGRTSDGEPVTIPTSRIQVFIDGPSGAGKSYLAGLLAEALITHAYTVCIVDMEGDHTALAELRGAIAVGGREPLPPGRS